MVKLLRLVTVFLVLLFKVCVTTNAEVPPTIEIIDSSFGRQWRGDWEIVELVPNVSNVVAKSRNQLVLTLLCKAPYPIRMVVDTLKPITNSYSSDEVRQCDSPEYNKNDPYAYVRKSSFTFPLNVTSAVEIVRCKSINHLSIGTQLNIFIPGEKVFLNSGEILKYNGYDEWIPCLATHPTNSVSLLMQYAKSGEKQKLINASYDAVKGFNFQADSAIGYICSAGENDTVRFIPEYNIPSVSNGIPNKTEEKQSMTPIIIVVIVLLVSIFIAGFGIYRYYAAKKLFRSLTEQEMVEFFKGCPELARHSNAQPLAGDFDILPYNDKYEILKEHVTLDYSRILGHGEFTMTIKGFLKSQRMDIAVRISRSTADVTHFKALLTEIKILAYIGRHRNVVELVGFNTEGIENRNLYIYMEFCELGSLQNYLRRNRNTFRNLIEENDQINVTDIQTDDCDESISTLDLIRWASEIATGMEYLSQKSVDETIVHMDLALRNILITGDKIVKISDFGMSKRLYECPFYVEKTKRPLPWRWMALESLKTLTFSTESDVWSYGVTLWEIFSLGDVPFPNENWTKAFGDLLTSGIRMGKPEFGTLDIYKNILICWDENPSKRPQFSNLHKFFNELFESLVTPDVDVELFEDAIQNIN